MVSMVGMVKVPTLDKYKADGSLKYMYVRISKTHGPTRLASDLVWSDFDTCLPPRRSSSSLHDD